MLSPPPTSRVKPGEYTDRSTNECGAPLDADHCEFGAEGQGREDCAIVKDPQKAKKNAQNNVGRDGTETGKVERRDMEIGVLSQEDPSNGNGTGGSTDGGDGDIHVENTDQFFEDEYGTSDGSVKRCRQACPARRLPKDPGLMFVAAGDFREQMTDAGANMYGGAFPAQDQAAADGQNTPTNLTGAMRAGSPDHRFFSWFST